MNNLAFYSNNNKHLKFAGRTSIDNLQRYTEAMTTPIRLTKNQFTTPTSIQHRRALGLVNCNSNKIFHTSSSDDLADLKEKHDESVILQAPFSIEDDLPYQSNNIHGYEDTFDDLIPADERIERMVINETNGINIFAFIGGIENTIRCQSPISARVDLSTLLDILN